MITPIYIILVEKVLSQVENNGFHRMFAGFNDFGGHTVVKWPYFDDVQPDLHYFGGKGPPSGGKEWVSLDVRWCQWPYSIKPI